jgi:hypothetical protein
MDNSKGEEKMGKYFQVTDKIKELVEANKADYPNPYSATLGTVQAILGMVVDGTMRQKDVVKALEAAIRRAGEKA